MHQIDVQQPPAAPVVAVLCTSLAAQWWPACRQTAAEHPQPTTHKLYRRQVRNITELKAAVQELWEQVPDYMLTRLMGSMERRLRDVVARQGRYTGR